MSGLTLQLSHHIQDGDKTLRETTKMASNNGQKLDELTRKLETKETNLPIHFHKEKPVCDKYM